MQVHCYDAVIEYLSSILHVSIRFCNDICIRLKGIQCKYMQHCSFSTGLSAYVDGATVLGKQDCR